MAFPALSLLLLTAAARAATPDRSLLISRNAAVSAASAEPQPASVCRLTASADYHSVEVSWRPCGSPPESAYSVGYCEVQAWGPNRCKTKVVPARRGDKKRDSPYQVRVTGLRMDTEYSLSVTPLNNQLTKQRHQAQEVNVRTKAFGASTRCLAGASELTVHTGPNFGGLLSVEDDPRPGCSVQGDPTSSRDVYVLRIDHRDCNVEKREHEVRTFVMVQEQDAIQTHSTRRFLVICSYEPIHSFTVSAGVNLPFAPVLGAVSSQVQEVTLTEEDAAIDAQQNPLLELNSREGRQLAADDLKTGDGANSSHVAYLDGATESDTDVNVASAASIDGAVKIVTSSSIDRAVGDGPPLRKISGGRDIVTSRGGASAARLVSSHSRKEQSGGGWSQLLLMLAVVTVTVFGVSIGGLFSRRAALRRRQRAAAAAGDDTPSSAASPFDSGVGDLAPLPEQQQGGDGDLVVDAGYASVTC